MLETTIAGSLPKPAWLAKPRMLWAPWQVEGEALVEAKRLTENELSDFSRL
jgi:5-methyltetrahydropteroyltriglutamate--homocysteine methyltransferase